jgi:hypothetical protein
MVVESVAKVPVFAKVWKRRILRYGQLDEDMGPRIISRKSNLFTARDGSSRRFRCVRRVWPLD